MRTQVTLACTECKRRNYTTDKNKSNTPDRMEFKKYCPFKSYLACQITPPAFPSGLAGFYE